MSFFSSNPFLGTDSLAPSIPFQISSGAITSLFDMSGHYGLCFDATVDFDRRQAVDSIPVVASGLLPDTEHFALSVDSSFLLFIQPSRFPMRNQDISRPNKERRYLAVQ
jgi:hypothetical protein